MVESTHPRLSIVRQCLLLGISRSTFYYEATGESPFHLELMRIIDGQFLETPFFGSRQMVRWLRRRGLRISRKRVVRLMRKMGLSAIYPEPNTSKPFPGHKIYPYLLKGMAIDAPNQVWCADVCYIPMRRGFLYLVAIMDWHSRKVLSWRLSNTLEADFCVSALREALARFGAPGIFNTDQGCQFTSFEFIEVLKEAVRRNATRFPEDFMFRLTEEEVENLRSQFATSSLWGGRRYVPNVFTEQGVAMLSSVLKSEQAIQVNIAIMRAFVRMRRMLISHEELARKVDALEKKYDSHFRMVFDAIRALMEPPKTLRRRIGF